MQQHDNRSNDRSLLDDRFVQRAIVVSVLILGIVLLLLVVWFAVDVFLLVFAGILVAIFLHTLGEWVSSFARLSSGWSLAIVILALVTIIGIGIWRLAPAITVQVDQLSTSLPRAAQYLQQRIDRYAWARQLLQETAGAGELIANRTEVLRRATGVFSTTLGALFNVVIIVFVGIYLAAEPGPYIRGIIHLVPKPKRERAREVLSVVGHTLRWWLLGRAFEMILVGSLTAIGLWLLDVPLALTLGLLAALLEFVPTLGPIIAAVPSILLAMTQSPTQALYVGLLYAGIQTIESYLLTPMVERRTVLVPPVLTIAAQVLLGILLGGLGLVLAPPLTATALVLVKMLYVEDLLGDELDVPGEHHAARSGASIPETGPSERYTT